MNLLHWVFLALGAIALFLVAIDPRRPQLALRYVRIVVLCLVSTLILTPFVWITCATFKIGPVLMEYPFLPPVSQWGETLGFDNFRNLFKPRSTLQGEVVFGQFLLNSLFLATAAAVLQTFFCSMAGYALAKYRFRGRRMLMLFMLGTMMLPGMLFLAPTYALLARFGWIDSYLALLVPGAVAAFGIFLFRQAMLSVPDGLIEAARVDGAGEFYIYWSIVIPLVRPMTAAFCLIVFMGQWNSFIGPQVFLQSAYKLTVPVVLNQYVTEFSEDYGLFLAGTFLSIFPIAVLFLVLQREFIGGLTSGAVKG
jgi:ABC-type glycerol-3-phosphate transport system permease component